MPRKAVTAISSAFLLAACATQTTKQANAPTASPLPPLSAPKEGSARAPASSWRTNAAAIAIIKESEGLRLSAYSDGTRWLIGYGHTATAKKGMRITEAQAESLLKQDLASCEKTIASVITVPVTENEFGAMASFCYNLGTGGYSRSSVVSKLNAGDYAGAGDAFLSYTRGTLNGVKQEIPHLRTRRQKERALFLTARRVIP